MNKDRSDSVFLGRGMTRARLPAHSSIAAAAPARSPASPTAAVLRLQRSVGNRALGRLLAPSRRVLARFAEREHKLIGDTAWRRRGDATGPQFELAPAVKMSYGDAVALGDYFESFDRMKEIAGKSGKSAGTQGELRYVLWVDIWGNREADKMDQWYDKGAKFHREQLNAYFDSGNIGHFPNPVEGDLDRPRRELDVRKDTGGGPLGGGATYRRWHEEALRKASAAGRRRGSLDEAYLTDGFACHFLTDAYSASHITTPRLSIKQYWDSKVPNFDKKLIHWLADKIDHGDWAWYERGGAYPVKGQSIHAEAIAKLLHKLGGFGFGDLVSLVVHDVKRRPRRGGHGWRHTHQTRRRRRPPRRQRASDHGGNAHVRGGHRSGGGEHRGGPGRVHRSVGPRHGCQRV